ncbi:MAG TPA: hypothetical protein VHS31_16440 [Tepidisphaeraceae bacterium]|nr:hypothetical protein [Tepidisphaeraceae bacterium]
MLLSGLAGCGSNTGFGGGGNDKPTIVGARVQGVNLNNPISPVPSDLPITLAAAKNEWASFSVQLSGVPDVHGKKMVSLRVNHLNGIAAQNLSAYQILPMPIDVNRAGFVRQTGLSVSRTMLPRALLPMPMKDGSLNLDAARDPSQPTDPHSKGMGVAEPLLFWVDLHIPPEAKAGDYVASCDLIEDNIPTPISSIMLKLKVYDFVLPDERHLSMVSRIDWDGLHKFYPYFETVEPRLMTRLDKAYQPAVHTLDQFVNLAQANRLEVFIPRLQPIVKWPAGRPPMVSWEDYDSVVSPWLKGDVFPDKVPLGFWPLPTLDYFENRPIRDKLDYWGAVASHFGQLDWMKQSAVFLEKNLNARNSESADSMELSNVASRILNTQGELRVMLPLEEGQIQLADKNSPAFVDPASVNRLFVASPGLVSSSPLRVWPKEMPQANHWLRTDLPGLIPYVGAGGDERDVRLWAWLAFLRKQADVILWGSALPSASGPTVAADPNELVWFYPGSWFGVDEPVPSIQLKWLRRAQQDYEYLWLAKQRGQLVNALLMARLITKPVEIQPNQAKDPTYALMSGTANPQAWSDAMDLLAKNILLAAPGQTPNRQRSMTLDLEMLRWVEPLERPTIIGQSTVESIDPTIMGNGPSIVMKIGIDVYNASDARPDQNTLEWTAIPAGWIVAPQPITIPALATYQVQRFTLDAQIDPSKVNNTDRKPIELLFTEPNYKLTTTSKIFIPVGASDRHPPGLVIDGSLEDWTGDDAICDGPMVQMFNRPALQAQQIQLASTPSSIYTGWSDDNFYVAFKVQGLSQQDLKTTKNFVSYQFRRAWGEDLCQVLIQPVYRDNTVGPVLHVVPKPNGSCWVEKKGDSMSADQWPTFEANVRYAATLDGSTWRGEIAIPWSAISPKGRPPLLKFNFVQHRTDTGESASWAGPLDFGRDNDFTGLLFIRDGNGNGMAGAR